MTFVLVRWLDAEHPEVGVWERRKELDNATDQSVQTCGHLVYQDAKRVRVSVSVTGTGEDEQYTGIMTIPVGCIVSMHEVTPGKKMKVGK